jgi:hypothetical protein
MPRPPPDPGLRLVCALQVLSITRSGNQNCVNDPASQSNQLTKIMGARLTERLLEGDYTLWIQQPRPRRGALPGRGAGLRPR